jgi:signal transduction histidine kinase/CheY-like chemotaxis protein
MELDAERVDVTAVGGAPLKPRRLFPDEARKPEWQSTLAEVDGVVSDVHWQDQQEYIWLRGATPFRATYRIAAPSAGPARVGPGMRVILRGILVPQADSREMPAPMELMLRGEEDVVVVDAPVASSRQLVYLFLSLAVLAGVWIVSLRRAVQERTKALKEALHRAEEGSRMKSSFVANMSHEIRTPLNAIIGFADLLMDGAQTEQRRALETIRLSANTLLGVINDVLDFSKIESGKLDLSIEEASPRMIVEEALDITAPPALAKGLDMAYYAEPGVPESVLIDPVRVRQVLINLLSNAVKFTDRGEVELLLRAEPEPGEPGQVRLSFTVRDTGIGIPEEQLNRLFQPFQQLDSSSKRRYGGTGLGLVISRHLIRLMHGELAVGSSPGVGTTFTAVVPCQVVAPGAEPPCAPDGQTVGVSIGRALTRTVVESLLVRAKAVTVPVQEAAVVIADRAPDMAELKRGCLWVELSANLVASSTAPGHVVVPLPVKPRQLWEVCRTMRPVESPVEATASQPSELRILVADDNAVNVKVVTSLLARLGHVAQVVSNGREVLAAMEQQPFDLIFLDIQMPEMDGLEAARRIREREAGHEKPWLVALTANAMQADRDECLAAGMNDHVAKPIGLKQLAAAIDRAETALQEPSPQPRIRGAAAGG